VVDQGPKERKKNTFHLQRFVRVVSQLLKVQGDRSLDIAKMNSRSRSSKDCMEG